MTFDELKQRINGVIESEWTQHANGLGWVKNTAHADASARIDGIVSGDAWVSGDARVSGNAHLLLVGPIGSRRTFLSIYADAKVKLRFTTGCFSGTRAQLVAAIKKTHKSGTLYRKQYDAALVMAKIVRSFK